MPSTQMLSYKRVKGSRKPNEACKDSFRKQSLGIQVMTLAKGIGTKSRADELCRRWILKGVDHKQQFPRFFDRVQFHLSDDGSDYTASKVNEKRYKSMDLLNMIESLGTNERNEERCD